MTFYEIEGGVEKVVDGDDEHGDEDLRQQTNYTLDLDDIVDIVNDEVVR